MRFKQLTASFALSLVILTSAASQSPDSQDSTKKDQQQKAQQEREKKALALLEEIIKEAQSLKLPENRIPIQVGIADLLWSKDEKRARALFKEAIAGFDEIARRTDSNTPRPDSISYREAAGRYQAASNPYILRMMAIQLRQEILQALITRDAKWAREFLRASRQPSISTEAGGFRVEMDIMMDISLANRIAEADPRQALEIAQESLDGAFSSGQADALINLMQQLQSKDRESASKLANAVMKKIRSEDFSSKPGMANYAVNLLAAVTRLDSQDTTEKPPASKNNVPLLDEQSLKDLVGKIVTAALKDDSSSEEDEDSFANMNLMALQSFMPQVDKYAPSLAPALRAKIAEYNKSLDPQTRIWSELASKGREPTAEDIVNAAAKVPADDRDSLYEQAAQTALAKGDLDRARQIANENLKNEDRRKFLLAEIERHALAGATAQGKLEDARRMLARVEVVEERAIVLAQLAAATAAKGDKKSALQLISEARGLVGYQPESSMQFSTHIEIARAAIAIDPAQSFEILEGMIEPFNMLMGASAAIDAFEGRQQFKEGEMILKGSGMLSSTLQYWSNDLRHLAREDIDRAKIACDRFQNVEVRLMIRLSIARGILSDKEDAIELPGMRVYRSLMNQLMIN